MREGAGLHFAPAVAAWQEVLGADLSPTQGATLRLALAFQWRSLVREGGLGQHAVVEPMSGRPIE